MATASVEVSGPDAERLAGQLRAVLVTANESGQRLAGRGGAVGRFGDCHYRTGIQRGGEPEGVKVRILLDDGTQVDLSDVDQQQLEIAFARRTAPGH